MNYLDIKKNKIIANLENSFFFKYDESLKTEFINYIEKSDNEEDIDKFSSIYNWYLEEYEKLDKKRIFNIHRCYDIVENIFKQKHEKMISIESNILESKLDNI